MRHPPQLQSLTFVRQFNKIMTCLHIWVYAFKILFKKSSKSELTQKYYVLHISEVTIITGRKLFSFVF